MRKPLERLSRELLLATPRLKPWGRMVKLPLCRRIACRSTCQAPTMMEFPGRPQGSKARSFDSELEE
eukprot:3767771-Amphidinium_carterae.1